MLRRSPKRIPVQQASASLLRSAVPASPAVLGSPFPCMQGPEHPDPHLKHLHMEHCHCELGQALTSPCSELLGSPAAGTSPGEQQPAWKVRGQLLHATKQSPPCPQLKQKKCGRLLGTGLFRPPLVSTITSSTYTLF